MTKAHRINSPMYLLVAAVGLLGCDPTGSTTVASQASALSSAQCTYQGFDATAKACFDTFEACKTAAGAATGVLTATDCRANLQTCLPPPPAGSHPGHGGPGEGGGCPGMQGGPGGLFGPPPGLDGGFPGGPGGPGGHRGHGGPPPFAVDSAAITACRDGLTACTAVAGADEAACRETEHSCVRDAFRAAFKARCDEAAAACTDPAADQTACAAITQRCTQGVDGIPPSADGGVCQ